VPVAADTDTLLLVQIDLPPGTSTDDVYGAIAEAADGGGDGPLARFCRMAERRGLLDAVELAAPGDTRRIGQFHA
jgi:hypothetical protein